MHNLLIMTNFISDKIKVKPLNKNAIMATTNNFRVRVMKYAWQLFKTTRQAWRLCMIKAWQLYRLAKKMLCGIVTFYYMKTDGSIRKANGTLRNLPLNATLCGKKLTKPSFKTMAYFDIDKKSFRCFRIENLLCVI